MIYLVPVLICNLDHLIVFLQNELRSLDLSMLIKIWKYKKLVERLLSSELRHIGQKHLLTSNELNFCRRSRLVFKMNDELVEFYGTLGWVLLRLIIIQMVLMRDLILGYLRAGISRITSYSLHERDFLFIYVRCTCQCVHGVSGFTLSQIRTNAQARIDARLTSNGHRVDIQYE